MNDIDFERAALLLAVVNSGSPDPLVSHIVGEARNELGEIDAEARENSLERAAERAEAEAANRPAQETNLKSLEEPGPDPELDLLVTHTPNLRRG